MNYSEKSAAAAKVTLADLGIPDWSEASIKTVQTKIGVNPDGDFGPDSIAAWKKWRRVEPDPKTLTGPNGCVLIGGVAHEPPAGVKVVNHKQPGGIPAQLDDTDIRKRPVTQFVLHRGAEKPSGYKTYSAATEAILDSKGFSTTFSMEPDGTIYQHFDPQDRRGRHAQYHNIQSDSIDVCGPLSSKAKGLPGQVMLNLQVAIGNEDDKLKPQDRPLRAYSCWSLTPEQGAALRAFLPWYCALRGIPAKACSDLRTFRTTGLDARDPICGFRGIVAHAQVSAPGRRTDGFAELEALKGAAIEWVDKL